MVASIDKIVTSNPNPHSVALSQCLAISLIEVLCRNKYLSNNNIKDTHKLGFISIIIDLLKQCNLACCNGNVFQHCHEILDQRLATIRQNFK